MKKIESKPNIVYEYLRHCLGLSAVPLYDEKNITLRGERKKLLNLS